MALPANLSQNRPRGLLGASASVPQQMPVSTMDGGINDPAAAPKKGFDWRKALGVLGDSLSIAGGGQATYVPNLIDQRNRRQAMDYAEQQYQRRRGDENADWMARQQWERANPKPVNNDTVNDFQWYKGLSPEDREIYHQMKPEYRPGPDGRFYRIDIAPQAPTFTDDDWNSGTPVNGGPTPSASGGFHR